MTEQTLIEAAKAVAAMFPSCGSQQMKNLRAAIEREENAERWTGLLDGITDPDELMEGYWWCPECRDEIPCNQVTSSAHHDACGRRVVWKDPLGCEEQREWKPGDKAISPAGYKVQLINQWWICRYVGPDVLIDSVLLSDGSLNRPTGHDLANWPGDAE